VCVCVCVSVSVCVCPTPALTDPSAAAAQQAVLQQQINALAYSPFGDSPLFRNPLSDPKKKEEVPLSSLALQTDKMLAGYEIIFLHFFVLSSCQLSPTNLFAAFETDQSNGPEGSDHAHPLQAHPAARNKSAAQGVDLVGGLKVSAV